MMMGMIAMILMASEILVIFFFVKNANIFDQNKRVGGVGGGGKGCSENLQKIINFCGGGLALLHCGCWPADYFDKLIVLRRSPWAKA